MSNKSHTIRFENLSIEQALAALNEIKKDSSLTSLGKAIHGREIPPFSVQLVMDEPVGSIVEREP